MTATTKTWPPCIGTALFETSVLLHWLDCDEDLREELLLLADGIQSLENERYWQLREHRGFGIEQMISDSLAMADYWRTGDPAHLERIPSREADLRRAEGNRPTFEAIIDVCTDHFLERESAAPIGIRPHVRQACVGADWERVVKEIYAGVI